MVAIDYQGAEVDHCHRCGGILIEPRDAHQHLGRWADPDYWKHDLGEHTLSEMLRCPVDGSVMHSLEVRADDSAVTVDQCGQCGSLWLDKGEGRRLADVIRTARMQGALGTGPAQPASGGRWIPSSDDLAAKQDMMGKPGTGTYVFQLFTGLPVEVWNPVHGTTIAMKVLLGIITAVFALQFPYVLSAGEAARETFLRNFGLVPELVRNGEHLWTILTHAFLHGGLMHFLGNAYYLWIFGDNVEDRIGTRSFVFLYFAALLAAAGLQVAFQVDASVPAVGASGAVAGIMGAYLALFPRVKLWTVIFFIQWRIPVWVYLGFWILLQVLMSQMGVPGVAWWAHIGGFVVGLGLGWAYRSKPHPLAPRERQVVR
jgi:membrane associated rhomboid family serine protease/Zn-finger nucleic acid-binding protein